MVRTCFGDAALRGISVFDVRDNDARHPGQLLFIPISMLFFASGFINYCFAMNNDYSFINSSDTSEQLALLDEFLSENYEFRHNVLSDVYEIRELGSEPKPFRPFTREARYSLLRRIKSWDGSMSKRMTVLWQIMADERPSAI